MSAMFEYLDRHPRFAVAMLIVQTVILAGLMVSLIFI